MACLAGQYVLIFFHSINNLFLEEKFLCFYEFAPFISFFEEAHQQESFLKMYTNFLDLVFDFGLKLMLGLGLVKEWLDSRDDQGEFSTIIGIKFNLDMFLMIIDSLLESSGVLEGDQDRLAIFVGEVTRNLHTGAIIG